MNIKKLSYFCVVNMTNKQNSIKMKNQENSQIKNVQNNLYRIYDSMGRQTEQYILAQNLKEAYSIANNRKKELKLSSYFILKRCYNTGIKSQSF